MYPYMSDTLLSVTDPDENLQVRFLECFLGCLPLGDTVQGAAHLFGTPSLSRLA